MSDKKVKASKDASGPGHISDAPGEEGAPKKKKKGLMLIMIPVVLLLLGGGGGALVFLGVVKVPFLSHPKPKKIVVAQMQFVKVPEMIANLDSGPNADSYAKMQAELEVPDGASAAAANTQMPAIIDLFQSYLRTMQPADLQGAEGLYRLREALLARANVIVAPAAVQDVLFTELIVQ